MPKTAGWTKIKETKDVHIWKNDTTKDLMTVSARLGSGVWDVFITNNVSGYGYSKQLKSFSPNDEDEAIKYAVWEMKRRQSKKEREEGLEWHSLKVGQIVDTGFGKGKIVDVGSGRLEDNVTVEYAGGKRVLISAYNIGIKKPRMAELGER